MSPERNAPAPPLRRLPVDEMPDALQDAWRKSMALRGDATFFEVFAQHPELYRWYRDSFYGTLFATGRVPRRFKELARYRLSTRHGCKFCNQGNRQDALAAGYTDAQLDAIDAPDGLFDDAERAVLQLAERLALDNPVGTLDAPLHSELRRHFDDAQILELGMLLGLLSGMAKFIFAFDLVEREDYCMFGPSGG